MNPDNRYAVLTGGIGGAKLALGLSRIVPADRLTAIVNTGDDFEHFGLPISPDVDTLMYTLAGEVDDTTGWGRREETWHCMDALEALGGETWFRLGDRDIATHARRRQLLHEGQRLTEATAELCRRFGVAQRVLPMSDDAVPTRVITDAGSMDFQHYFVRDRAEPRVRHVEYHGAERARPSPEILGALREPGLAGIVIAPSNPWLSIDPILAIPAMRAAIRDAGVPVVAVSPIVGATAIKGPTAKIMGELGLEVSAGSVAAHYGELLDGFIIDDTDRDAADDIRAGGLVVETSQTVMQSLDDRIRVAESVLELIESISRNRETA
ncbi:MAG: 2-phospho-L-lactate transferase [Gammaproteobacteria bacterium]